MQRHPSEIDFEIPQDRIAQYPTEQRDDSRLLVYDRSKQDIIHIGKFPDVIDFIAGDLVVLNNTRVIPALVEGQKRGGGKVWILFLASELEMHDLSADSSDNGFVIKSLINPGRRLKPEVSLNLPGGASYYLKEKKAGGKWTGVWHAPDNGSSDFFQWLQKHGNSPLPPYIQRQPGIDDRDRYQTVYAETTGSLAAPTAGLHFTKEVINRLINLNTVVQYITLDVGIGTFMPIRNEDILNHKMHEETYSIPQFTADAILHAKAGNRKVTAVGTTVVRTLEDAASKPNKIKAGKSSASIFIYPPYEYRIVDRLLTNFHREDSTLIQLVAAFMGWDGVNKTYKCALDEGFRFFSYGDSMLIL